MQCIWPTKKYKRCKNQTKFLLCHQHKLKPLWLFLFGIPVVVGLYAGIYQDLINAIILKKIQTPPVQIISYDQYNSVPEFELSTLQVDKMSKIRWESRYKIINESDVDIKIKNLSFIKNNGEIKLISEPVPYYRLLTASNDLKGNSGYINDYPLFLSNHSCAILDIIFYIIPYNKNINITIPSSQNAQSNYMIASLFGCITENECNNISYNSPFAHFKSEKVNFAW
ncbi:hypothetical protein, partial [uncultured Desulfobacter sp.]|uniref:hypothetical protein n=1 Tax=uncultured Desulfobacter sp. TaxID=240139 RepID=UPI00259BC58F